MKIYVLQTMRPEYRFRIAPNWPYGSGVMTISFYIGLTRNPETGHTPSELCPISRDWGEYGIPNFARTSLIKCYWILQNARVTAFTISKLLRENQQEGGREDKITPDTPRLGFKNKYFIFGKWF